MEESTKTGIIVGIIVTVATGIICILLAVIYNEQGKRMDDLHDIVAANTTAIATNATAIANLTGFIDGRDRRSELRLVSIEHEVGLPVPFTVSSPVCLTEFGEGLLRESGMEDMLAKHKTKLIETAKAESLSPSSSINEVEDVAIKVVNNYPYFEKVDALAIEGYMLNHPEGRKFDIWAIAGISFRNILLKDLGIPLPHNE